MSLKEIKEKEKEKRQQEIKEVCNKHKYYKLEELNKIKNDDINNKIKDAVEDVSNVVKETAINIDNKNNSNDTNNTNNQNDEDDVNNNIDIFLDKENREDTKKFTIENGKDRVFKNDKNNRYNSITFNKKLGNNSVVIIQFIKDDIKQNIKFVKSDNPEHNVEIINEKNIVKQNEKNVNTFDILIKNFDEIKIKYSNIVSVEGFSKQSSIQPLIILIIFILMLYFVFVRK